MKKIRIIETEIDGKTKFIIQKRHWFFIWIWLNAAQYSWEFESEQDTFDTLQKAKEHIHYFMKKKPENKTIVVYEK